MKKTLFVLMMAMASAAGAQTVNPPKIYFDHDDRAITTTYDIGYFLGAAPAPVQTVSVPVASTVPDGTSWQTPLPRPVLGTYTAKMRACGDSPSGSVCSPWSDPSGPFSLTPKTPVNVRTP